MPKFKVYSPALNVGMSMPFTVTARHEDEAAEKVARHMWGLPSDYIVEEIKEST